MGTPLYRNDKRLTYRWAMYDWANSVYSLTIATAVFPIYYTSVTGSINGGMVKLMGREYMSEALYSYALSFSFILVALLSPLLAPIADYRNAKLGFMKFFCYTGAISCVALYWFTGENIGYGLFFFILASVGFAGSIVYYNAFLKEIVDESQQDKVSARGFSLGYIGSVLLLIINLMMVQKPEWFGISDAGMAARLTFVSVGIWWACFAQIPFNALGRFRAESLSKDKGENHKITMGFLLGGYNELRKVWNQLKEFGSLRNYLYAFFFYNAAVQTVMYMASIFGSKIIFADDPDGSSKLIICILLIQIVAVAGAALFSRLSTLWGNARSLSTAILIWLGICCFAYVLQTQVQFYVVAFIVGLVMGGIQSISRSTYSKLLPATKDTASFFSFYDATEKVATVFGTLVFGLVTEFTGDMRNSVLFLLAFFVVGLSLLWKVRNEPSILPAAVQG